MFGGINYAADIWANGAKLGSTRGAFIRGQFDLTPVAGENVVAVRVSPPPHPGIPHEQSISAGVGENGGQLAIDGPTSSRRRLGLDSRHSRSRHGFVATVNWSLMAPYGCSIRMSSPICRCRAPIAPTSISPCRSATTGPPHAR